MTGLLDNKQVVASMLSILPYLIIVLEFPVEKKMTLSVFVSPRMSSNFSLSYKMQTEVAILCFLFVCVVVRGVKNDNSPAIKVPRLNATALTCCASQTTSTVTIDAPRDFCLTPSKLHRHTASTHAKSAFLCNISPS